MGELPGGAGVWGDGVQVVLRKWLPKMLQRRGSEGSEVFGTGGQSCPWAVKGAASLGNGKDDEAESHRGVSLSHRGDGIPIMCPQWGMQGQRRQKAPCQKQMPPCGTTARFCTLRTTKIPLVVQVWDQSLVLFTSVPAVVISSGEQDKHELWSLL